MTEQSHLHHLLDRMRRGVLLPAEREQLAWIVGELEKGAAGVPLVCSDERHEVKVAALTVRIAELEAAVDMVRRLCNLTIAASVRVQAVEQARDTLAILDHLLTTEATR